MANNMPKFDKHPCPGDAIVWRNGGFTLTARIEFDGLTRPGEFDCYSEEDIEKWESVEWCYVGIVVSAEYKGWLLEDTAASLWGLECGLAEDSGDYLSDVAAELFAEALQVAKVELAKLRDTKHRGVTNDRP
jgi:hypothetical protein